MKKYWVGVLKIKYTDHDVINETADNVTPQKYPQYDYIIGPFDDEAAATARAKTEKNQTGMFTDPFCNDGGGR